MWSQIRLLHFATNKIMPEPNGIHVDFRLVLVFTCYFSPNTFAVTHGKACQTFEIGFAIKCEKYRLGKEMHKELGPSRRQKKYQEKEKKNYSAATTELATLFSLQSLVCTTASYLHIAFFLFFEVFPLSIYCGLCSFIHLPSCWAYSMCAQMHGCDSHCCNYLSENLLKMFINSNFNKLSE